MEIDHMKIPVLDYEAAKKFYGRALAPFGFEVLMDWHDKRRAYLGVPPHPSSIWLVESRNAGSLDVALTVGDELTVDALYWAFVHAGARSVFESSVRHDRPDGYYVARVVDSDGNAIEFVHRRATAARADA